MCHRSKLSRTISIAVWSALALAVALPHARAATPYEFQIGGFISSLLQIIIIGEFAGRRSNADASPNRPICKPEDYDDLRATANDRGASDAFRRRCNLVESIVDDTHIHVTAYLPAGYCETLRAAFDNIMDEYVYATPAEPKPYIVYKGARSTGTGRALARNADLKATCRDDGSLRVSAPRKRKSQ